MKESTILESTRKYALWAAIVSSVVLLVLLIMWTWGAFNLTNFDASYYLDNYLGGPSGIPFTAWAKAMLTLSAVASTSASILLALLIAKYARKEK
ncbi:MAG: hypothetical protein JW722_01265 [Demequinaceae bacterium]|nr:hypothetical protein [Demequinaceae bacterium]